jgi:trehalose 6-phosphate synthase/phosphatase
MEFTLARQMHGSLVDSGVLKCNRVEGSGLPGQGLVIISEFVSSARVMRGALIINPWRVHEVKELLNHSLRMEDGERADRSRRNLEFSTRLTTANWAKHVLYDLKSVEGSVDPNASYAVGFGLQYKVMNLKAGFQVLDVKEACKSYRDSRHRLILLDWGGTLVPNIDKHDKLHAYAIAKGHAAHEGPTEELKEMIEKLCSDARNVVFVVSGKEVRAVTDFFGKFKGLGLAAEHGFYYKWPQHHFQLTTAPHQQQDTSVTTANGKTQWQTIMDIGDQTWKESAKVVMDIFVQRTHGTYIEQKGNALIWQYSDADPEFGFLQSKELEEHLNSILASYPVEVIRGGGVADGYIEVRPTGADKGSFLEHALSIMKASNIEADFILAIGDDSSDEPMFDRIGLHLQEHPKLAAYSVTVGKKPTSARAYLDDPSAVAELLQTLSRASLRERRFHSAIDLPSQALKPENNHNHANYNMGFTFKDSSKRDIFELSSKLSTTGFVSIYPLIAFCTFFTCFVPPVFRNQQCIEHLQMETS